MKALLCRDYGPVENLAVANVAPPSLDARSVRIALRYASINGPDVLMPQGRYQVKPPVPFVPGVEGMGTVTEIGSEVPDFKVGDRVMTYAGKGCFAEEVVAPAARVHRVPSSMPDDIAAGFTLAYGTSYYGLVDCGRLASGDDLVVLGASGGLGLAAVEIGRAIGARAIAVASTREKLWTCLEHGADATIDISTEPLRDRIRTLTEGRGASVVYDIVGGEATEAALRAISPLGRLLIAGYASGEIPLIKANLVLLKQALVVGVSYRIFSESNVAAAASQMRELCRLWEGGHLKPAVTRRFSLDEAPEALRLMSERKVIGKVVLQVA